MKSDQLSRSASKWSQNAKRFWKTTLASFVLEDHHRELLAAACQQLSRADQAREILATEGVVASDRFGQSKEHPAVAIERQAHLAFLRIVRELGLDVVASETRGPRRAGTE